MQRIVMVTYMVEVDPQILSDLEDQWGHTLDEGMIEIDETEATNLNLVADTKPHRYTVHLVQ